MTKRLLIAALLALPACVQTRQPPIENGFVHDDRPYNDGTPR